MKSSSVLLVSAALSIATVLGVRALGPTDFEGRGSLTSAKETDDRERERTQEPASDREVVEPEVSVPSEPGATDETGEVTHGLLVQDDKEQFKWLRETTPRAELERELNDLNVKLGDACRDEVMRRLDEGEYETVKSEDGFIAPDPRRMHLIEFYTNAPDGTPARIVLPDGKFPELYAIKRQVNWLGEMIRSRDF